MSWRGRAIAVLALGRIAYGTALVAAPGRVGRSWLGEAAMRPGVEVALRGLGVRDLALSVGVLAQAEDPGNARPWLLAAVACDVGDIAATLAAGESVPERSRAGTVALAGGAALAGLALCWNS